MSYQIDFAKVDKEFQRLSGTPDGQQVLQNFGKALDAAGGGLKDLNEHEKQYVLANLVRQRQLSSGGSIAGSPSHHKVTNGFVIKTAVEEA